MTRRRANPPLGVILPTGYCHENYRAMQSLRRLVLQADPSTLDRDCE